MRITVSFLLCFIWLYLYFKEMTRKMIVGITVSFCCLCGYTHMFIRVHPSLYGYSEASCGYNHMNCWITTLFTLDNDFLKYLYVGTVPTSFYEYTHKHTGMEDQGSKHLTGAMAGEYRKVRGTLLVGTIEYQWVLVSTSTFSTASRGRSGRPASLSTAFNGLSPGVRLATGVMPARSLASLEPTWQAASW